MSLLETTAISRTRPSEEIPGYRLDALVGTGGMGEVHKATQLSLERTVAVKLLNAQLAQDASFVARFDTEAAALAALQHPNIVSILDKGRTDSTYYLVMEFVDGPSLREVMRSPLLDSTSALKMMLEICRAIEYAHRRGVIHRDLKPENILFDDQAGGVAKVTDFGLASFLDDSGTRFDLTSTHVAMGTLSYMAPEQRVDAKGADERADIFALGVMLYELLVGEVPLGTFEAPSRRKPEVDLRLDAIVARCLKPAPADRYPSVSALIADLEPLVPGLTAASTSASLTRMQRVGRAVRRGVRLILQTVATLLVLAAMGVLAVAWLRSGEKRVTVTPGAALTADLGPPSVQRMAGRVTGREQRKVTLGEGPDPLSLLVSGRPVVAEGKALVFPPVEGQSRVGLARVDVVGLEGGVARFIAKVGAEAPSLTYEARARALLFGPPPDPQTALVLLGSTGRYVALVHDGAGAPLRLEWALGERQGTMLSLPSPPGTSHLELTVDGEGVLRAWVGKGRDRRALAEPLLLGPDWQKQFGEVPVPAFGCIEGTCRLEDFSYLIQPAPPPPAAPAAAPREPPPPRRRTQLSTPSRGKRSR